MNTDFHVRHVAPYFYIFGRTLTFFKTELRARKIYARYIQHNLERKDDPLYAEKFQAVKEGIRYIQGAGWPSRSGRGKEIRAFEHIAALAYRVSSREYSAEEKGRIFTSARLVERLYRNKIRKEIRERPTIHHQFLAAMMGIVVGMEAVYICALLHHDDLEDLPGEYRIQASDIKRLSRMGVHVGDKASYQDIAEIIQPSLGELGYQIVDFLTNKEEFANNDEKHAWQLKHIAQLDFLIAVCKCLDRISNLSDYGERAEVGRAKVLRYLIKASQLLNAALGKKDNELTRLVWMFFAYTADFLYHKYLKV